MSGYPSAVSIVVARIPYPFIDGRYPFLSRFPVSPVIVIPVMVIPVMVIPATVVPLMAVLLFIMSGWTIIIIRPVPIKCLWAGQLLVIEQGGSEDSRAESNGDAFPTISLRVSRMGRRRYHHKSECQYKQQAEQGFLFHFIAPLCVFIQIDTLSAQKLKKK